MEKNGPDHDHVKLVWGFRFLRMYFSSSFSSSSFLGCGGSGGGGGGGNLRADISGNFCILSKRVISLYILIVSDILPHSRMTVVGFC